MSQTIEEIIQDILTACQVLTRFKIVEGFGHVSARIPGKDSFLITPRRALVLVGRDDLAEVSLEGEVLRGNPPLEHPMHAAVYRNRPDVQAICRGHPRHVAAFASAAQPIRAAHGFGANLGQVVPVLANPRLITTRELGEAVARTLGSGEGVILQANGMLAVGESVPHACVRAIFMEETAEILLLAQGAGLEPRWMSASEVEGRQGDDRVHEPVRAWEYYVAMLGR